MNKRVGLYLGVLLLIAFFTPQSSKAVAPVAVPPALVFITLGGGAVFLVKWLYERFQEEALIYKQLKTDIEKAQKVAADAEKVSAAAEEVAGALQEDLKTVKEESGIFKAASGVVDMFTGE